MLPRFCLQSSGKVLLVYVLLVITNVARESVVLRVGSPMIGGLVNGLRPL